MQNGSGEKEGEGFMMSDLALKYTRLKTAVGGNREKYGFEYTYGVLRMRCGA